MRKFRMMWLVAFFLLGMGGLSWAADDTPEDTPEDLQQLEDVVVEDKAGAPGLEQTPQGTVIDMEEFKTIGPQISILDTLKTQAIVDFRGSNALDPGIDSIYLRGFSANRFVTAIDGLTIQKTGGRKSSNIVDYALIPTFLIKDVEILAGPHSALYDSKSIGGVINMVSVKPRHHNSLKPDVTLTTSYGSYETWNNIATAQGAVKDFTYDLAYRRYLTEGYLRHNDTDIETLYGRIGYLLPADGFVTLSLSGTDTDRDEPVNNPGTTYGDYDSDYPKTEASYDAFQDPTWDGESHAWRLNMEQPSPLGLITLGAYSSKERRNRAYYASLGDTVRTELDTTWWSEGVKFKDDIQWLPDHTTTVGFDLTYMYDNGNDPEDDKNQRINKKSAFLQHRWDIFPSLELTLGLRYEYVKIHVSNWNGTTPWNTAYGIMVGRDWNQLIPKSFLTYKMDDLASWLRDTSLSVGISKIWRAPDYHGNYNPQGRPSGIFLEPEHGVGYDLVLERRLWRDIIFKIDYSFYKIKDFITANTNEVRQYNAASAGALRFSDYSLNLEEVYRQGIDVELGGHLTDDLSFYLGYSWQDFENQGDEPAGEEVVSQRAEHRVSAGLRYQLFAKTALMLDYYYQSDEVEDVYEEVATNVYDYRQVEIDAYHTVDFGIEQVLCENQGPLQRAVLNLYVKNLFDEKYYDTSGYEALDRYFGASLTFSF